MKRKKGFTLTEVILTLGVAAIIISAVMLIYPKVSLNEKTNKELQNIVSLSTSVRSMFSGVNNYTQLDKVVAPTAWAISANLFPENMLKPNNNTQAYNSFGGEVFLSPSAATQGTDGTWGNTFKITYTNVPAESCVRLVSSQAPNLLAIQIQGLAVSNNIDTQKLTIDYATVASSCAKGGNNNTIVFYFY